MPCNWCGFDGLGVPFSESPSTPGPSRNDGTRAEHRCERCGVALLVDEPAAPFRATLRLLGQFGLASHTRLLLGTTREDG